MKQALPPRREGETVSTHYAVVDDNDRLVGGLKHASAGEAKALKAALVGMRGVGRLHVALVTETTTVRRDVVRS